MVGAGVAEPRVGHVHDVGSQLSEPVVAEAQPVHDPGREVLGHRVRDPDQVGQQLLAPVGAQVEGDAELLDVVVVEARAAFGTEVVIDPGPDLADDVPHALPDRVLDANDLGAEGGQHPGRPGPGQLTGQIADAHVVQRAR